MNAVIQSVLRLSRREDARREELSLAAWVTQFAEEFRRQKGLDEIQLEALIEPADSRVLFDPDHLHQVLWNLCENALTYGRSADGRAYIRLQGGARQVGRHATLDVMDQGPGVSAEISHKLFEPFITSGRDGTGLGLYIARELCENNGGGLEYLPLPTGGSCFRIHFPVPE